jgi:hypothetical protein
MLADESHGCTACITMGIQRCNAAAIVLLGSCDQLINMRIV